MVVSRIMCHIHMTLKNRIHHFHPFSNQNILRIVPPKRYIPTPAPHLQHSPAVGAPGLEKPSKFRGPDESRKRQPTNHLTLRTGGSHLYFCSKPLRSASWLVGFKSTHWWKMFFFTPTGLDKRWRNSETTTAPNCWFWFTRKRPPATGNPIYATAPNLPESPWVKG